MDAHGIGTDATMADHIKTVLTRDYALREVGGDEGDVRLDYDGW